MNPIKCSPFAILEEYVPPSLDSIEWILEKVKGFYSFVGLSCFCFEADLMSFLLQLVVDVTKKI